MSDNNQVKYEYMPVDSRPTQGIIYTGCDFHLIEVPSYDNKARPHLFLRDFLIERKTKTIDSQIALFLGISHEWCTQYIGGDENYTRCKFPNGGFNGRLGCYLGITMHQLRLLWDKAKNNRAFKYKPILADLMLYEVFYLFEEYTPL